MNSKIKEFFNSTKFFSILLGIIILLCIYNIFSQRRKRYGSAQVPIVVSSVDAKWSKLFLILDQIEKNYVDTLDYEKVSEEVLPILLQSLDPHSVYLPPQELEQADESLSGNFSGIGIEFNIPNDTVVVINAVPGGPSEKVGILSGDRIVKVEDIIVAGVKFNQDSIVKMLRGPIGSVVNVEVVRAGVTAPITFAIRRDIIPLKSLDVAIMITPTLGYIKLSKFSKTTHDEFVSAAKKLVDNGMKSLLLDLRDNPGGYMDQAYLLASEFLQKGDLIVYMQGRSRPREDLIASGSGKLKDIKLYIAINENSASSSEIVTGAIQDNDRGTIVGRRSYGKGLVQEPIYFSDGSGIRLTVARFYTPSGRSIQKPYSPDYNYDILERYTHGELQSADSIKKNDSLVFKTLKLSRPVYGGGGIIPDIFVPLDTMGVTPFLINVNRRSLQMKFSSMFADQYRKQLLNIKSYRELDAFFSHINIGAEFRKFAKENDLIATDSDWEVSGRIIEQQLKGLIGRYSGMDDDAYYSYIVQIDNLVERVKQEDDK